MCKAIQSSVKHFIGWLCTSSSSSQLVLGCFYRPYLGSMAAQEKVRFGPKQTTSVNQQFPGFFKVIGEKTLKAKKLEIPIQFSRKYSDLFSDDVNLILPSGEFWEVGLIRSKNEFYFDKNWNEFVETYSIQKGYFLTFEYKRFFTFEVRVYTPSGCKIICRSAADQGDGIRAPASASAPCSFNKRTILKGECSKMPTSSIQENLRTKQRMMQAFDQTEDTKETNVDTKPRKAFLGNRRAIHACRNFKTTKPSFNVTMREYHFNYKFVHLPSRFTAKFLKAPEYVTLQVSSGGEWSVKVNKRCAGKYSRFTIGNGWDAFQKENNLKIRDICIIQLVKTNAWRVSIFRD